MGQYECFIPILTAITTIGLDHTDILGETEEEIALQKAGIIKKTYLLLQETFRKMQ